MSSMNNVMWFSSAIVAGILGAAGLFLLSHLTVDARSHTIDDNPEVLRMHIKSLEKEIESLRKLQEESRKKKEKRVNRKKYNNVSYASDTDSVDYRSIAGTDLESDEEYFDLSPDSDEDVTLTEDNIFYGIEKSIDKVDELLKSACSDADVKEAYEILTKMNDTQKNLLTNDQLCEVMWRICRCCQRLVNICEQNNDEDRKNDMINEGIEYGKQALVHNPNSSNAHKWYAILVGMRSKTKPTTEKVEDGNIYLHHIREAIKLNPTDPVLYHLQGRFKFEIASLSWFQKKAAATIFSMEVSNFDEALEDFNKAEQLVPLDWKENRLYIAKCYIGKKDYKTGVKWLKSTISIANKTSDDHVAEAEAKELLYKYE